MIARAQRTADQQREIDVSLGLPRELRGWRIENAINAREGRKAVRLIAWAVDAGGPSVMPFPIERTTAPRTTSTRAPAGRTAGATRLRGQRG